MTLKKPWINRNSLCLSEEKKYNPLTKKPYSRGISFQLKLLINPYNEISIFRFVWKKNTKREFGSFEWMDFFFFLETSLELDLQDRRNPIYGRHKIWPNFRMRTLHPAFDWYEIPPSIEKPDCSLGSRGGNFDFCSRSTNRGPLFGHFWFRRQVTTRRSRRNIENQRIFKNRILTWLLSIVSLKKKKKLNKFLSTTRMNLPYLDRDIKLLFAKIDYFQWNINFDIKLNLLELNIFFSYFFSNTNIYSLHSWIWQKMQITGMNCFWYFS